MVRRGWNPERPESIRNRISMPMYRSTTSPSNVFPSESEFQKFAKTMVRSRCFRTHDSDTLARMVVLLENDARNHCFSLATRLETTLPLAQSRRAPTCVQDIRGDAIGLRPRTRDHVGDSCACPRYDRRGSGIVAAPRTPTANHFKRLQQLMQRLRTEHARSEPPRGRNKGKSTRASSASKLKYSIQRLVPNGSPRHHPSLHSQFARSKLSNDSLLWNGRQQSRDENSEEDGSSFPV